MVTIRDVFVKVFGKERDADYEYESVTICAHYTNKAEDEEFWCVSNIKEAVVNGFDTVEFDVLCEGRLHHIKKNGRLLESVDKGMKSKPKSVCYKYDKQSALKKVRTAMAFCSFTVQETRGCLTIIDTYDGEVEGKIYLNTDLNYIEIFPLTEHYIFEKIATNLRKYGFDVEVANALEEYRK